MKLRDRFREAFRTLMGYPEPAGGQIVPDYRASILDNPFRLDPVTLDFAKAVRLIGTVRVCVLRKAMDAASRPLLVEREVNGEWEPVERAPGNVVDVLHAGNPRQAGREVIRDWHANYYTHGMAYMVAETFGGRKVKELWVMPSHLTTVIPGPRRMPKLYLFSRGGLEEAIPAENVIAWHDFQPEDDPVGSSPLESVQLQYETRYDLMRMFQKVVRGGGVASGYFKVPATNGVPTVLTQADKDAIAETLRKLRAGNKDIVLDVLDFVRMGLTMQELQFIENTKLTDADICNALGVPPWMVGITDGGKLGESKADAETQERLYWTNLQAELEIRDAILTERMGPMFGEKGVRFRADMTGVIALSKPVLNAAQQAVALTGRPVLTVNELRRMVGQQPLDDPEADELQDAPEPVEFGQPASDGTDQGEAKPAPVSEETKALRLIDTPERAERWRAKDSLRRKYETRFERALQDVVRDRRKTMLKGLEESGLRGKGLRTLDLDELFSPDEDEDARIQRIYEQLIAERGKEAAAEIGLELEVALQTQRVRDFILQRKTYGLDGALNTMLESARISLADGISKGESLAELSARLVEKFGQFEDVNALTIARTEAGAAFNFATAEAWKQSGEVEAMEWLSARDSAVRESHAEADGQVARLGGTFQVGGSALEYPGDPSGPPEETINCRCALMPVLTERARRNRMARFFPKAAHTNGVAH